MVACGKVYRRPALKSKVYNERSRATLQCLAQARRREQSNFSAEKYACIAKLHDGADVKYFQAIFKLEKPPRRGVGVFLRVIGYWL